MLAHLGISPYQYGPGVLHGPVMLANGVGGLHNDLLMVGLMAALVVGAERARDPAALIGGLAAAVKVPGGLVCVGIALLSLPVAASLLERVRRLTAVDAVSIGLLLALGVITGLGSGWVHGLTVPATVSTPLSVTTLADNQVGGTGALRTVGTGALRTVGTVVSAIVIVAVALRWRTGSRVLGLQAVALVVGAIVVLGPVVHLWYLLWVVPFLAVLRLARLAMAGLLAACTIFGLVAPLDSSLHEAYYAIVLGSVLVGLLVPLLLLTRRSRRRIERIVSAEWIPHPRAGSTTPVTSPSAMRPPEVPGAA